MHHVFIYPFFVAKKSTMTSITTQNFKENRLCLYFHSSTLLEVFVWKKTHSIGILRSRTLWYNVMDNSVKSWCHMTRGGHYLRGFAPHLITSGKSFHDMWLIVMRASRHSHATRHIHNTVHIDRFPGTMWICIPKCLMWYTPFYCK